ncbi:MAG TPA: hypothetical protein VF064_00790 [Pyrinomonadaceae bacterium]
MRLSFMVFTPSGLLMKGTADATFVADAFALASVHVRENIVASTILYAEESPAPRAPKEGEPGRPIYIARAVEIKSSARRALSLRGGPNFTPHETREGGDKFLFTRFLQHSRSDGR